MSLLVPLLNVRVFLDDCRRRDQVQKVIYLGRVHFFSYLFGLRLYSNSCANLPQDLQDDLLFNARTASDGVRSWKAHQLRMVHQDTARTDIIDSLQEDSVLITQDFAMKFLPTQYRETQADFFGKRGISWHLTVCQSKQRGELVAQTFVHIIESGLQDSHTVVTVMEHVLKTLKQEHSELTRAVYRQDNAGC